MKNKKIVARGLILTNTPSSIDQPDTVSALFTNKDGKSVELELYYAEDVKKLQEDHDEWAGETQRLLHAMHLYCDGKCPTRNTCTDKLRTPEQEKCPLFTWNEEENWT